MPTSAPHDDTRIDLSASTGAGEDEDEAGGVPELSGEVGGAGALAPVVVVAELLRLVEDQERRAAADEVEVEIGVGQQALVGGGVATRPVADQGRDIVPLADRAEAVGGQGAAQASQSLSDCRARLRRGVRTTTASMTPRR